MKIIPNACGNDAIYVPAPDPCEEGCELQIKTATQNGALYPDEGYNGMSRVNVDVPNSYTAFDEGKVVQSGALVAQTSQNITENGTYDTTTKNSVNVNVSGGGNNNLFYWNAFKNCGVRNGTGEYDDTNKSFTLHSSAEDCYTYYGNSGSYMFPIYASVYLKAGDTIKLSWDYSGDSPAYAIVYLFDTNDTVLGTSNATVAQITYTATSDIS